jgi:thymidylate synthase
VRNGFNASSVWLNTLSKIFNEGLDVAPRGMKTLELQHHTVQLNMSYPVVLCPKRQLSYTFLAAEALWILAGDDRVETIAPYNKNIAAFSDDGHRFFGAYGPRIMEQFEYVVGKLLEDRDTRQAVMTIWRKNPPKTKDVPCTVAIMFSIRNARLHCHVFMRSSDAWLGLPYDVFNFSLLSAKVACEFNRRFKLDCQSIGRSEKIALGYLHLTAASSHLYERNFNGARLCLELDESPAGVELPASWIEAGSWKYIEASLTGCREKVETMSGMWRIRP